PRLGGLDLAAFLLPGLLLEEPDRVGPFAPARLLLGPQVGVGVQEVEGFLGELLFRQHNSRLLRLTSVPCHVVTGSSSGASRSGRSSCGASSSATCCETVTTAS